MWALIGYLTIFLLCYLFLRKMFQKTPKEDNEDMWEEYKHFNKRI